MTGARTTRVSNRTGDALPRFCRRAFTATGGWHTARSRKLS